MHTKHNWITTPITADLLRGALDLEHTACGVLPHRLPARARAQCADGQLAMAEAQPSGVRLVFRTRATAVELDALPTKRVYAGAPPRPDGVYDLIVDGRLAGQASVNGGNTLTIDMATGTAENRPGPAGTLRFTGLPDGVKDVEIWLPHNETTELVALRAFTPAIHGFLDTIREGHPTTPLLVVSPILCPIHEDTPGPSALDFTALSTGQLRFRATGDPTERASGKLTLGVIRDELARIVEQRAAKDPNLHYLDGRDLYGEADSAELPLPDQLHPGAAAHRRIGERFAKLAFTANGLFADRRCWS
ncbi:MAG: lipase [Pseudonocardiaceae bacterium]